MYKFKLFLIPAFLLCITIVAFQQHNEQAPYPNRESLLMDVVIQSLHYNHYAPQEVNDAYSEKVFKEYIESLDFDKRFFLQEDIKALKEHQHKLDDYALARNFGFFDEMVKLYDKRVKRAQVLCTEVLETPFSFNKKEMLEADGEKVDFVKTEAALKNRWRKRLKWSVLQEVYSKEERQRKALEKKDTSVAQKTFAELEIAARKLMLKRYTRLFDRLAQEDRDDKLGVYVNAYTHVLEPHTGYFPPIDKENFNIQISGKLEGIGAQLTQEEDGYLKVTHIVPGSASFREGTLKKDDIILKVGQGEEEPADIADMKMDDAVMLIRGKKGTEVRLTVRKIDGTVKVIPITRDVVVMEERYAKSAIINHKETGEKIGLIDLRSFYADFNDANGRRCSKDVKREVQKLIAESVDGIVIDLRFNGGGSLSDVVDMSGLFIPTGPIVQVKGRSSMPYLLEDTDPDVLYDGKLIIMVNSHSASASEILAAALQDYARALIVGTAPSTFGKGTVQRFVNLDDQIPPKYQELGELGALKITIQKFYRINGGSTQLKGVTPDIILPGVYTYLETGEKEEKYPMPWTQIEPAVYRKEGLGNVEKLQQRSKKRVAKSEKFQLIDEQAKWVEIRSKKSYFELTPKAYTAEQKKNKKRAERYKVVNEAIECLTINSLMADQMRLEQDSTRAASIKNWHKVLKRDVYLEEVMYLFKDM